ncbi:hypothetical protein M885DRAFT_613933 [Pelagophyceae sp. CCMP2097]|nr:hypothetical protein M885DRAFT_613933 [Pelagophyceae sp. CCMP2097]|mmetsp:Transcript_30355/g.102433  ORF Transcript_30355/g.102433 Transcript_30355/m.102433 type:complete len:149 (+) Transcript_30355:61-507(+)|eukprot:CAMPEP_0184200264 /NCGR_PEP_ID=MMETSP0976-20121227/7445_1 /TAXON_ID=483370 /ORGANISM="non described non described, Strain CCMP2097" /LENGTH=148 /DNA_ID=CAMNT_0026504773 /DNA_START=61 /DNA_END=507 /DNA_ORIENTATION=-
MKFAAVAFAAAVAAAGATGALRGVVEASAPSLSVNATDVSFNATECDAEFSDQAPCDADAACAWCTSRAVPAGCKALEDAKALPASIFQCDKVHAVAAVECSAVYSEATACDADDTCTWCASAAVPAGCKAMEDAKGLPKSIFKCDKL